VQEEARDTARDFANLARDALQAGPSSSFPLCIVAGGETTVTVKGTGLGGRNQELALAVALELEDTPGYVFLSAGTDGTDGPTDAAGAVVDSGTLVRARSRGLDARAFLENNDSHRFFKLMDDLVVTGPTLTNVNDLMVLIVYRP
jgi:glycerate-2-kinase